MIKCKTCSREYEVIFEDTLQGVRCAANILVGEDGFYVWCHYGSGFDGNVYKFVDNDIVPSDPVCDNCIEVWLDSGELVPYGEDAFFEFPE